MLTINDRYEEFRRRHGAYGQHGEDCEVNPELVVDGNEHKALFENGAVAIRVSTSGSPQSFLFEPPTDQQELNRNLLAFYEAKLKRLSNWHAEKVGHMQLSISMPNMYHQPKAYDFEAAKTVGEMLPKLRQKVDELQKQLPPPAPIRTPWQDMKEYEQRQNAYAREQFQKLQRGEY